MATRNISKEQWRDFLDTYSQQHERWLVTIAITTARLGVRVVASSLPLRGITYDPSSDSIEVWGSRDDRRLSHVIERPKAIYLVQRKGADHALHIESADAKTRVTFRSAVGGDEIGDR